MIENLSYKHISTIISQYKTEGHAPLKVLVDNYEPYVFKFPKNSFDKSSIAKEFLCHYFLKCWNIPTPAIAGLSIPQDLLINSSIISRRDKVLIGDNIYFGSKLLPNSYELNDLIEAKNKTSQKRIINAQDIFKIALFDIWVENEDRKPTNNNILLQPNKKGFILNAIDHAFTFSSINFNELTFPPLNYCYNESILYSNLAKSIIDSTKLNCDFYLKSEEMFYLCIQNTQNYFSQIVAEIPVNLDFSEADATFLAGFLFNKERNNLVFQEFFYILKKITK